MLGRLSLFAVLVSVAVSASPAERPAVLGKDGVLRWQDTRREVALFGVNYYVPFAMDYELLKRRQLDHRQAIRDDLEHFRRLGLDVIRLHCWDREISDRQGNLLDNEHLALLDYLLAEARKRGIYAVLTPIAWWGTPNACDGFSNHYDMPQMTTEEAPRKAQQRFLGQFVTHRNRFTGKTHSEDPAVIAFEVINEPLYPPKTTDAQVTEYINALVDAIREAGCTKPVAYNCWGGRHKAAAAARCDALTFGWYPTGLVGGRTILNDCLPTVDKHHAMHSPALDGKLKMVYEFDAADVQGSYMYPAIARSFRSGGVQIAAQFQYDVMALAAENKNWQTHYLNLVYTPGKALSFAIAAKAFRSLPRGESYGT
ncbi:MAG: cellulase family glycosylhydrolase, partial [Victivallales bacterium]|nr:cellulase family glycosylhydrolase [Victivallales bacterium]